MEEQPTPAPITQDCDDATLLQLCREHNDQAFCVLYNRYRLQLYSYLHRLMANRAGQVDDLFQQTWIKATQNLHRYDHRQKFLAWLCRIAHNLAMDFYRSRSNALTDELPEHLKSNTPTPTADLCKKQLDAALKEAIGKLPPEQQEVVRLRNDGIPFKEIAEKKQISLNTALGRMHYAVQNLRKMLADYL